MVVGQPDDGERQQKQEQWEGSRTTMLLPSDSNLRTEVIGREEDFQIVSINNILNIKYSKNTSL